MSPTCNLIRFRRAPVPTLMILLANSTPMVCDDSTLHSFFTNRCSRHDLSRRAWSVSVDSRAEGLVRMHVLSCAAGPKQNDLCQVIIHAPKLLYIHQQTVPRLATSKRSHLFRRGATTLLAGTGRLARSRHGGVAGQLRSHRGSRMRRALGFALREVAVGDMAVGSWLAEVGNGCGS